MSSAGIISCPRRAVHIIPGLSAEDGGPSYSVPRLCDSLSDEGWLTSIMALEGSANVHQNSLKLYRQDFARIPMIANLRISRRLQAAAFACSESANIIHSHGMWLMPNVYAGRVAARLGKPLIVSPRGMLAAEALKFSPLKKKAFWQLLQARPFRHAAVWHATSEQEVDEIRAFGVKAPIALVPNGIDVAAHPANHSEAGRRTLLFLSRVHPKKGLPTLITAWARIAKDRPDWDLKIVGPDEGGHLADLVKQARVDEAERIEFSGAVYGDEKGEMLRRADLFVLPTRSENFGIAVAEALAAGVPVIVTKGAPWEGVLTNECGWWIDQGADQLEPALLRATGLSPNVRRQMGARGMDWMQREFGWEIIGKRMAAVYDWLLGLGQRPTYVLKFRESVDGT